MLATYFSPLAPAAVLLLGAFVLSIGLPRLPQQWPTRRAIEYFSPPAVVGLAVLALLGMRLSFDLTGLELVSGWNFSTEESVAALMVRADGVSLSFLILALLVLLAITLANPTLQWVAAEQERRKDVGGWLAIGGLACLLFVAANGLTMGYVVLAFDVLSLFFWLGRGQLNLGVARLFLGIFTAAGLVLAATGTMAGAFLLGLGLWLRLGLYPFVEASHYSRYRLDYGQLVYLALSLSVGFYLVIRSPAETLASIIPWLAGLTLLLNGLLTWLADDWPGLLVRLVLAEASLLLLGGVATGAAVAYTVGLVLSLVALWVTPRLGKPQLTERAWPWLYLPAAGATLTLAGLPLTLGWAARPAIYHLLLLSQGAGVVIVVGLLEGLALSGLVSYWVALSRGSSREGRGAAAGVICMVPFLIPGLGPFVLAALTRTPLSAAGSDRPAWVMVAVIGSLAVAVGLGYFKPRLKERLPVPADGLVEGLSLGWLFQVWAHLLGGAGKGLLRVEAFLQGQHYLGWAFFAALVGLFVILLGT